VKNEKIIWSIAIINLGYAIFFKKKIKLKNLQNFEPFQSSMSPQKLLGCINFPAG